jgi:guanylate kinase
MVVAGRRGILFIVSGPSGAGKTTLSGAALATFDGLVPSVSCTTRSPREGERDGVDYRFVDAARFDEMVAQHELAEWAEVHGYRYGTPRAPIEKAVEEGGDVLLDIDVEGASQIKKTYPEAVSVFLLPPDRATLEARLRGRGTDSDATVRRRLENACREIARAPEYDYVVVNRAREEAIADFLAIVDQARVARDADAAAAHDGRRRDGRSAKSPLRMDDAALRELVRSFGEAT